MPTTPYVLTPTQQQALNEAVSEANSTNSFQPFETFVNQYSAAATVPNAVLYSGIIGNGPASGTPSSHVAPDIAQQLDYNAVIVEIRHNEIIV